MDPVTLTAILKNPMAQYIGGLVLSNVLANIMPAKRSPYEAAIKSQLQYSQAVLPMMFEEARGIPSLATKARMQGVNQEINRLQQTLAATAQRNMPQKQGIGRSEMVGQQRYQMAKAQAYGDIIGQQQTQARAALLALSPQAVQGQLGIELREKQYQEEAMRGLATILSEYKRGKNIKEFKPIFDKYMQAMFDMLTAMGAGGITPQGAATEPGAGGSLPGGNPGWLSPDSWDIQGEEYTPESEYWG